MITVPTLFDLCQTRNLQLDGADGDERLHAGRAGEEIADADDDLADADGAARRELASLSQPRMAGSSDAWRATSDCVSLDERVRSGKT